MPDSRVNSQFSESDGPVAALSAALRELGFNGDINLVRNRAASQIRGFAVVPNPEHPSIIVPTGSRRASAAALHRFSADSSGRQRLQRVAAAAAFRIWGARAPIVSHSLVPENGMQQGVVEFLSTIFGEQVLVSMGIGTQRANRKPILQIFSVQGRTLGFAKVGTNSFTAGLVERESAALETIGSKTWSNLVVPKVFYRGPWKEGNLLVMSGLPTSPISARRNLERLRHCAQQELQAAYAATPMRLAQSPWFSDLKLSVDENNSQSDAFRRLGDIFETISNRFSQEIVDFGMTHGDWTPWNMSVNKGKLQVWDWERFSVDVPVGFDELHYSLHLNLQRVGLSSNAVIDGTNRGELVAPLVTFLYLGELAARYLLGGQSLHVDSIEAKAIALIEALEQLLED